MQINELWKESAHQALKKKQVREVPQYICVLESTVSGSG